MTFNESLGCSGIKKKSLYVPVFQFQEQIFYFFYDFLSERKYFFFCDFLSRHFSTLIWEKMQYKNISKSEQFVWFNFFFF